MTSQDYWRKREQANIARLLKKNIDYEKAFRIIYSENYRDISLRIDALYRRYGDKNGEISLAEVKAIADKTDVEALAATVKRLSKDKDYSDYANNLMARYNLKMQVSRLELLRDEINTELVKNSVEVTNFMTKTLTDEARNELKRQAGILGSSLDTLDAKALKTIVNGSFGSATFSERLWGNTQYLANELNTLLTQSIINGRHPTDVARALRKIFDVNQKQAERLMRTESARVHAECAVRSMEKNGVTWYEWVAEPSACEMCSPLDGKVFEVKGAEFGNVKHPLFPLHPNCRCAVIPAVERLGVSDDFKDVTDEEMAENATNWYTKSLDSFEKKAITGYTADDVDFEFRTEGSKRMSYKLLNLGLRNGTIDADYGEFSDEISNALSKYQLTENIKVHRGMSKKELNDIIKSGETRDYKSTTLDAKIAKKFADETSKDGYTVTILVPKGTNGAYIGNIYAAHSESEFLLNKGQKFKKISVDSENKTAVLEVIL